MTKTILRTGAAVAMSLALVTNAQAQLESAGSPSCSAFDSFMNQLGSVSYLQCGGAFTGNDANQDVAGWLSTNWGLDAPLAGKTDADVANAGGPFMDFTGSPSGQLTFATPIVGEFVLALKTANAFSLYHFNTGGEAWDYLEYGTEGVSVNGNDKAQDLSHASIYGASVSVPEPGVVLLLLSGLCGLGMVAWRRKEEVFA